MESITRTIYGSTTQTALLLGITPPIPENTTLNERFDILRDVRPPSGVLPRLRYFSIGNGGHKFLVGADGVHVPEPVQHLATDAAAYKPLPFVLRTPNSDLTPVDRAKYALRKEVVIKNKTYIAYYLKRIDIENVVISMQNKIVDHDITTVTDFVPDHSNLNPNPQDLANSGINITEGRYVTATAKLVLTFNKQDIDELLNVAKVLYDNEGAAIISEIQMVSGVDHVINVNTPGAGSFNFNEAIGTQVVFHVNSFYPAKFASNLIEASIDVGAVEPLFKLVDGSNQIEQP